MKPKGNVWPQPIAVVAILAVTILAGCTDTSVECEGGVCREIAQPGDVFLTNATRPVASWEGCQGAIVAAFLPREVVDAHIPEGFVGAGPAAFTRDIRLVVLECPRAVIADTIVEPFSWAMTSVVVLPENDSWEPPGVPSNYVYELFVSDDDAASIFAGWGLPAMPAAIQVDRLQVGLGYADGYTIEAEDRSYAAQVPVVDEPGTGEDTALIYWSGEGSYHRVDGNFTTDISLNFYGPTTLVMGGNAKLAEIVGASSTSAVFQAYRAGSDEWSPYPNTFSPD